MKQNYLKRLFTALLLMCAIIANAHDFEVDGVYYRITDESAKEVAITFYGETYDEIDEEYIGNVVIPSNILYNGMNYAVTSMDSNAFWGCTQVTGISIPKIFQALTQVLSKIVQK